MKANELRIGNITEKGVIKNFWEKGVHVGFGTCYEFNELKPVEITEEWLLKFDLDYTSEKEWYDLSFTIKGLLFQTASSMEGFTYNLCFEDMINIKYVHQLQNLYFSLTGEELRINQ